MKVELRAASGALLCALFAVGCSRTPPEPSPPVPTGPMVPTVAKTVATATASKPADDVLEARKAAKCPPSPDAPPPLSTATVVFPDAPGRPRVEVEVAKSPDESERGLMYRTSMPEEHGMLFRLGERREHVFWMHNTCIPLDMLFVEDDGTIAGIVERAEPMTDTSRTVGKPSSWVLEVNGGWTSRHGVRAGQKLELPPEAR